MTRLGAGLVFAWALAAGFPPAARAGTCTINPGGATLIAHVPGVGDFEFSSVDQRVLTVDVDANTGTLTLHRDGVPPLDVGTQGGPVKLLLDGPAAVGSIDGGGGATIAAFPYSDIFASQPLPSSPRLTTATYSTTLNGIQYPVQGVPLDFTTGLLSLEGTDILENTPLVSGPSVFGLRLVCRLAPIPDPSTLPTALRNLALSGIRGIARAGKAGKPDMLSLQGVLVPGIDDLNRRNFVVSIRAAADRPGDTVLVFVPATAFHKSGHRFTAQDKDGTALRVLAGRKGGTDAPSRTGGVLVVKAGKRSNFRLRLTGLDLSGLAEQTIVTVGVGPSLAPANVAVSGGSTRHLH